MRQASDIGCSYANRSDSINTAKKNAVTAYDSDQQIHSVRMRMAAIESEVDRRRVLMLNVGTGAGALQIFEAYRRRQRTARTCRLNMICRSDKTTFHYLLLVNLVIGESHCGRTIATWE